MNLIPAIAIRAYHPSDEAHVISLWRDCGLVKPQNDPRRDIARKLRVNPEWFLVGDLSGRIVATIMVGYEGHRGWINYLAVEPALQKSGVGRTLMAEAERVLCTAGCPKINLQVRSSNAGVIAFYHRLGFVADEVVSLGKRLEYD
ncbi:MAG: GNAT family acetyltransferase [Opitutaceae bacterium]